MLWSRVMMGDGGGTGLNGPTVLPVFPVLTREWGWERGTLGIVVQQWYEFIVIPNSLGPFSFTLQEVTFATKRIIVTISANTFRQD